MALVAWSFLERFLACYHLGLSVDDSLWNDYVGDQMTGWTRTYHRFKNGFVAVELGDTTIEM
jgi:hypothetical protein